MLLGRYMIKSTEKGVIVTVDGKKIGHLAQHEGEVYLSLDYGVEGLPIKGISELENIVKFTVRD